MHLKQFETHFLYKDANVSERYFLDIKPKCDEIKEN